MSDRLKGMLLLVAGVLTMGGVSTGNLPVMTFWLGLLLYPIGGYYFLKGNRQASEKLERRVQRTLNPTIRSQSAKAFAQQQSNRAAAGLGPGTRPRTAVAPAQAPHDEIVLEEVEIDCGQLELGSGDDADFKVSEDVSFPVEVQERSKIADELRKLVRLFEDGRIDEREFDAAKARLLE